MKKYQYLINSIFVFSFLLMIAGCASTPIVKYNDPKSLQVTTADFASSDLQQIANTMVDSLLVSPTILQITNQHVPVLSVSTIKNKSMEHIDTESITDTIRTKLIQSGKFKFIDRTTDQEAIEEINMQKNSPLVDKTKTIEMGKQYGAEYLLTGNISQITQESSKVTDIYFKFTLNLKNLTTGLIDWSSEKEIRKTSTRRTFGG